MKSEFRSSGVRLYLDQTVATPRYEVWFLAFGHLALGVIVGLGIALHG
jgi:hypothetical protein